MRSARTSCLDPTRGGIALALSLALGHSGATAQPVALPSPLVSIESGSRQIEGLRSLAIDREACAQIQRAGGGLVAGIPLADGATIDADLAVVSSCDAQTQFIVGSPSGEFTMNMPDVLTLSGPIEGLGSDHSHVILSIAGDAVNGYIETPERIFIVSSGGVDAGEAIVFDASSELAQDLVSPSLECGVIDPALDLGSRSTEASDADDALDPTGSDPEDGYDGGGMELPCRVLDVAIDTDYELTRDVFDGNPEAAAAYVVSLVDAVSTLYQRDLNIALRVVFVRVWSDDVDPYGDEFADLFEYFNAFALEWDGPQASIERDIAHLISGRRLTTIAGLGVLGALCERSRSEEFAGVRIDISMSSQIQGFFPSPVADNQFRNFDAWLVAHEMGHNLNAIHTSEGRNFFPALDGCGFGDCSTAEAGRGTIMSFCARDCPQGLESHVLRFHPKQIGERIFPELQRKVQTGCLVVGAPPEFVLIPEAQSVEVGQSLVLEALAEGSPPISYEWLTPHGFRAPTTNPVLVIEGAGPDDEGVYAVWATNSCGRVFGGRDVVTVEFGDCDGNGTRDDLDLGAGAPDLNGNSILDECEGELVMPSIIAPVDGSGVFTLTPRLEWEAVRGATSYTIEIEPDSSSPGVLFEAHGIEETSFVVPEDLLRRNATFTWRVRAIDDILGRVSVSPDARVSVFRPFCIGDANLDGLINFGDITAVLANWGAAGPAGDTNRDKSVNIVDVATVLTKWLEVCE